VRYVTDDFRERVRPDTACAARCGLQSERWRLGNADNAYRKVLGNTGIGMNSARPGTNRRRATPVSTRRSLGRSGYREIADAAPVFAALGDKTRLHIVSRLCRSGPLSIARLTVDSKVSRQAVSKHLRSLEEAGLVSSDRTGRERIWELHTRRLAEARHCLDEISDQWDGALQRLRLIVEGTT
jgi:DNA-binding transcriptional ArsR family regulator